MNERETAVFALIDILNENGYNNIVLRKTFNKNKNFNSVQKSFVTEIVNGTLRNIILIDYIINQFSNTPVKKMKPLILNVIRISVYQIMFMDKVPVSAVCNEAVNITKKNSFKTLTGFVNAVLRNISRNYENIKYPDENKDKIKYLSVMYSYPEWIIKYWLKEFEYDRVKQICIKNNDSPKVSICINSLKTNKAKIKNILNENNINVLDGKLSQDALYISKTSDITKSKAFKDGLFHVMDESSMVCVDIMNPEENSTVMDLCSAPGGKSFYCAYKMKNKGNILSRDIYEHKINLINDSVKRLGIKNITTQIKDASFHYSDDINKADFMFLDMPCSGLGLLRKKPDIKYTKTYDDIEELSKIQRKIFDASWKYVKKDGIIIYSTCTISKKENIENIEWILNNYPFELDNITDYVSSELKSYILNKGCIQILPDIYNTDGFFIARLKRKE